MSGQVKKSAKPGTGNDIAGRFGAWWSGQDYVAPTPEPESEGEAAAPEPAPEAAAAPVIETPMRRIADGGVSPKPVSAATVDIRLKALETLWGAGRFAPGSLTLDSKLLDPLFETADKLAELGFIGADGALLSACRARTDRVIRAVEWRTGCVEPLRQMAFGVEVHGGDVDRPRGFADASLEGLVSIEAFAYADHKAGLVARAHRALSATGRWVFLDTTRRTAKTPAAAFASAWAEPLLSTVDDIEELLDLAGFRSVRRETVTPLVLEAARLGYSRLSGQLEAAAQAGLKGREGAIFLQELAWEVQSWRARMRALEGGALSVDVWIAEKGEPARPDPVAQGMTEAITQAMDQGAVDSLFD